jgi:hypothetical protein
MEGIEKPHMDKYKESTNNWNYDVSCTLTSLPVWDLKNFKRLIFIVQSVPKYLDSYLFKYAQEMPQNYNKSFRRLILYTLPKK